MPQLKLLLHPKQRKLLELLKQTGPNIPRRIGWGGSRGAAKALDIKTPIPVPSGWKTMADLQPGDEVFSQDGSVTRVVAISDTWISKQCVSVKFSDGSSIECDADHLWETWNKAERLARKHRTPEWRSRRRATRPLRSLGIRPDNIARNKKMVPNFAPDATASVRSAKEILATLKTKDGRETNHCVSTCDPVCLPEAKLPIEPYILGVWLGAGASRSGGITSADPEIMEEFHRCGYEPRRLPSGSYSWGTRNLTQKLRAAGLIHNKHVPPSYLRASAIQRLELLRGLMDIDGTVSERSGGCCFSNTNRGLVEGVLELCLSLGIKCVLSEGIAKLNGVEIGPCYKIHFTTEIPSFRLKRKLERQKTEGLNGVSSCRYIVAVAPASSRPVKCIQVEHPSGMFLCGRQFIPTHNSGGLRRVAMILASEFPGIVIVIVRKHLGDLLENHVEKMRLEYPEFQKRYYRVSDYEWRLDNGSRIVLAYGDTSQDVQEFSRGPEFTFLFVDQAEQFTEKELVDLTIPNRWPGAKQNFAKSAFFFNPGGPGTEYLRRVFHKREFKVDETPADWTFIQAYGWDNYEWFRGEVNVGFNEFYEIPGEMKDFSPECLSDYCRGEFPKCKCKTRFEIFVNHTSEGRKMRALDPSKRLGELFGSFDQFSGQYYASVWDETTCVLTMDQTNMLIQPWWQRWISQDWGFAHSNVTLWWASGKLSPEVALSIGVVTEWPIDVAIVYRELVCSEVGEDDLAIKIADLTPFPEKRMIQSYWLSPDAWAKKGKADTVADQLSAVLRRKGIAAPQPADNDRVGGWRLMYNGFQRNAWRKGMPVEREAAANGTMLLISAACPTGIASIPMLVRDEGKPEDVFKVDSVADDWADCFTGDTPVLTPSGMVPISSIRSGDLVETPLGPRRVLHAGMARRNALIVEARFSNGVALRCTKDHRFWTEDGYLPIVSMGYGEAVCTHPWASRPQNNPTLFIRLDTCDREDVYDIEVEDTHNFYAGGILVHNCARYGYKSQLDPKSKAPREVRAREVYESHQDPTSRAIAMKKFSLRERRNLVRRGRAR